MVIGRCKKNNVIAVFILLISVISHKLYANDHFGVRSIEEAFAIATLMSDSDALTFGFSNFDLSAVTGDAGFGSEESINLKNSLDVFVLPYTWQLASQSPVLETSIMVRAFFIKTQRENQLFSNVTDKLQEKTYGIYGSYQQLSHVSENWSVQSGLGLHLSYYQNSYDYGEGFPEQVKPILDKNVFNVSSLALILEPEVGVSYLKHQHWGKWRAHNNSHYIYGHGIAGSVNNVNRINPEGWRVINGVEFTVDVPELWGVNDFLSIDFKRIDVFGDMRGMSEKNYYYETSFGWVIDTNNQIPLLDNIGVGLSINYGSSISGGTLVLYYNE